jgi:hypothetical protein
MAEIPLDKLKVGDRVVATLTGGQTAIVHGIAYTGTIAEINRYPTVRGQTQVLVWLDRQGGTTRDLGLRLTVEDRIPEWTFTEDPAEIKKRSRSLAEIIALGRDKPENGELLRVQDPLRKYTAEYLGLKKTAKKGGRRRRKTRKSRN